MKKSIKSSVRYAMSKSQRRLCFFVTHAIRGSGPSTRASPFTSPACSAILRKPSHRVSVPNSSTMTLTDSSAIANSDVTIAEKTPWLPAISHCASAATAAVRKKPNQRRFSISEGPARQKRTWSIVSHARPDTPASPQRTPLHL